MDDSQPTMPASAERHLLAQVAAGVADPEADLHDLLQRFLGPVMRLGQAQAAAVRVLGDHDERLHLVGAIGLAPEQCRAESSMDRHCGFCGAAADSARLVWADDLRLCREVAGPASCSRSLQHMLVVPLQHRGNVLGVYNLYFAARTQPADEVQSLLRSVGELLGLALHNARLEAENLRTTLLRERQAMAAEVHDSIAQTLAFVKMRMPLLQQAIAAGDETAALRYCHDVRQAVSTAHGNLREVLSHLRAPMDPLGLKHALRSSILSFRELTQVDLSFDDRAPALRLTAPQEFQVYRIVQEALANVAKHANARHAWLTIEQEHGQVRVQLDDDGAGLGDAAGDEREAHFGLGIMQERAAGLGGALVVAGRPGGGTRVRLSFPAAAPAPQPDDARAPEVRP